MAPEKICEGCGRHWSDPIPANCPECGAVLVAWVTEEPANPSEPDRDYTDATGTTTMMSGGVNYYCGQCNIFHKADSGIGLRHRPE